MRLSEQTVQRQPHRDAILPDVSSVPAPEKTKAMLQVGPEPGAYYALSAHQCQCLAVSNAAVANAIDEESELASAVGARCRTSKEKSAALLSDLLACEALAHRNEAAADALGAFYRLAEAEAQIDLLNASLEEVRQAIADVEHMERSGLHLEADSGPLHQQRIVLEEKRSQAEDAARQLNAKLRAMLGGGPDDRTPIWPRADLSVTVAKVDRDQALLEGLGSRADLHGLRLMQGGIDAADLSSVRKVLAQLDPALGVSPSRFPALARALGTAKQKMEAATRQQQVSGLLHSQQNAVEAEIRAAADAIEARLVQIALCKERRDRRGDRLARLEERRGADGVSALDVTTARLELYEAEGELLSAVIAWKLAEVQLLRAEGVLPLECGFPLPEGSCRGA